MPLDQRTALIAMTALLAASASFAVALQPAVQPDLPRPGTYDSLTYSGSTAYSQYVEVPPPTTCGEWAHFTSEAELRERVNSSLYGWYYPWVLEGGGSPMPPVERSGEMQSGAASSPTTATSDAGGAPAGGQAGAPDYSQTNVQVGGVDEPDAVKTDGWYIYTVNEAGVHIVRAYPPSQAQAVTHLKFDGQSVYGIFVNGDKLVVLTNLYTYWAYDYYGGGLKAEDSSAMMIAPYYMTGRYSVLTYNISDVRHPALTSNLTASGYITGARMLGNTVMVVASHTIALDRKGDSVDTNDDLVLPTLWVDGEVHEMAATDIGYFPDARNTSQVTTVMVANLARPSEAKVSAILTESGSQLYVSRNSVYLIGYGSARATNWLTWEDVSTIHRLYVYGGKVHCAMTGEVRGHIHNQFSVDEYGGNLRIATTEWSSTETRTTRNAIFVLNATLDVIGKVGDIAPGETIQSVRFVGARAYVVTFLQIDPLFVIDLSTPTAPAVLGQLKVPGFSQYLHPISDTLVLGVGVETAAVTEWERTFTRTVGLKVSLFNVSDPVHPTEAAKYVIEGTYVNSEAQWDHHAFLWIASKNLLVLPVEVYSGGYDTPYTKTWQGVYVWDVSDTEISLRGTVTHSGDVVWSDTGSAWYDYWHYRVRRALFIGEFLYTVSDTTVKVNDIASLAEVASVTVWTPPAYDYPDYGTGGGTPGDVPTTADSGPIASPPPR